MNAPSQQRMRRWGAAAILAATVAATALSCQREAPRPGPLLAGLLNLATREGERPAAVAATLREVERIAGKVAEARRTGLDAVAALRQVVFTDLGYTREVDSADLRYVLLPPVTGARQGSCVGLGTLYLALAERLRLPLEGVLVPGHFFVRARTAGVVRNVELLHQGEVTTDDFYRQRYPTGDPVPSAYWRPLTVSEILAVVAFNVANQRREQKRLGEAEALYRHASQIFPTFAEAHASLGLTRHLEGKLNLAQDAYAAARALQPNLLGLDRNTAALAAEMKVAAAASVPVQGPK